MDDKNNIHDELNEFAPNLSNLRKDEPFSMPDDYFDDLASKIQDKCADADEISGIAPVLAGLSKYNPFTVPADYFDDLPAQIQQKCMETRKPSFLEKLAILFRPGFAIPLAAVIIAAVIAFVLMRENTNNPVKQEIAVVTEMPADSDSADVITEDALLDLDDAEVLESLWSDPVTEISENTEEEHQYVSLEEDEIMDYLLESNTDVSAIVNEL